MSNSYLRVELRSPKRGLDGGYGFDLTKYCASCWSRFGKILKRGARCGICGKRVCKGCRHFVAAKEWICALCYRKKYTPEDTWHDDANIKRFKGSQGKSGTYLLRLTDWSAHGVLEVHKVNEFQTGGVRSFYNESFVLGKSFRNKIYRKNCNPNFKSHHHHHVRQTFNYPLVQRDIQLRNCKTLDGAMNSQSHKEKTLKYTSVTLKQKRREMREYRAMSIGRSRFPDGISHECQKKSHFNRINPTKREQFESMKTLLQDYDNPLTPSVRRSKHNLHSCTNSSWQKEHRRSRKNCNNPPQHAVSHRNEPHIRLSVRGTRIFGRGKSFRAYPTLKGDARSNGSGIKCRSASLPCELSQVESHDYEFWNSGFVQSRVRRLEEELTSKCDDKYIFNHDYEVQSLCSLQLDKILPDGDDYRIAYLSSTSQESSLDYMDDNYCTIGMGTLDVKLNKKCVFTGNEDWDLTLSSPEENDTSSDDDEFFYRRYSNLNRDSAVLTPNCYSRNTCTTLNNCDDILQVSKHDRKHSDISCVGSEDESKSITQQIHESVDRIFYNVMNYDLDSPLPVKENQAVDLEYISCLSSNDKQCDYFHKNEEMRGYASDNFISRCLSDESCALIDFQNIEKGGNVAYSASDSLGSLELSENISADDFLNYDYKYEDSVPDQFSDYTFLNTDQADKFKSERLNEILFCNYNPNYSLEDANSVYNMKIAASGRENIDSVSKCLFSENDSIIGEKEQIINVSTANFSQSASEEFPFIQDLKNTMSTDSTADNRLSEYMKGELNKSNISKIIPSEKNINCSEHLPFPNNDFEVTSDYFSKLNTPNEELHSNSKRNNPESKNITFRNKFRNSCKRLKYKMKRDKWTEEDKIKSFLEVELIFYEPLCTPFAEIYFITYGKKYPTKCYNKLSIPRKILSDVKNEVILKLINQNSLCSKQLHSSNAAIYQASQHNNAIKSRHCENDTRNNTETLRICSSINNFMTKCSNEVFLGKAIEQFRNYKLNLPCVLASNNNHFYYSNLIPLNSDIKIIQSNPITDNHLLIAIRNQKIYFQHFPAKYIAIAISRLSEMSENVHAAATFKVFQNNLNRVLQSADVVDFHPNISGNVSSTGSTFESVFEVLNQNFRFLKEIKLFSFENSFLIIDIPQLGILPSPFSLPAKSAIENSSCISNSQFYQTAKPSKKLRSSKIENKCQKISRISERKDHLDNSKSSFDIFSKKHVFKTKCAFKRKAENYSRETNKTSKYIYRTVKIKKYMSRKKKWNAIFRNIFLSKSDFEKNMKFNPVSFCKETIGNILLSFGLKFFISENCQVYQQMKRNRNYGISYYVQEETEITNEVQHAGKISESRFAVESQPKLTTSLTGNATFVEYLFPPQLASVRDTTKTRLSVSSIQYQSVPAVQHRLVDRESRFVQSGKDLKHGSFYVASASGAASITDRDCCGGSPDFCASESLKDGYPITLNSSETKWITYPDHDFVDYLCFGSVPKGLQQLICNKVSVCDINWDNFYPESTPFSELPQNMATCDEDPRLIKKITRTPGRNISKLKKLFDSRDGVASDSDISYSKNDDNSANSSHSVTVNNTLNHPQSMGNKPEVSNHNINGHSNCDNLDEISDSLEKESTCKSQQRISSDIPYCRKAPNGGDLWKNVDTGVMSSNSVLWSSVQNNDNSDDSQNIEIDSRQGSNSFVSSTADLHNLIASSRAELSKKKEPLLSDKSTLENYFTSFENSKPKKCIPLNSTDQSILTGDFSSDFLIPDNETFKTSVSYGCGVDELNFDEEDATLSDTSSDEEFRCNPPINTHYLPAYALHTIIEESCEESERDSRGPTPTNEPVTSNLERYFSWDIINDTETTDAKRKDDGDSTVFSDSLSEGSGSINGDASKEIDPSHLASSRLEKYFTSGLVGNENYFYPDDAEFLEDAPVSDFEEDSIHQKISRSALLSSLETVSEQQKAESHELLEVINEELVLSAQENSSENKTCDNPAPDPTSQKFESSDEIKDTQSNQIDFGVSVSYECIDDSAAKNECEIILEESETQDHDTVTLDSPNKLIDDNVPNDTNLKNLEDESIQPEVIENAVHVNDGLAQKQTVSKEQLAIDVRAIIKKLLMYFSGTGSNSFKHNMETDYTSAWKILETEIERLIQSISPTASLENHSCNSSTIDSNNSDYGSDTIESLECITDEDEAADSKNRGHSKYPIVDLFNAAYKIQPGPEFHNFNISDETLSIWKRLIQSLQKDSFCMNDNKLYDPNTEARLYIRDQIVNLMHTVTVSENKGDEIDQNVLNIKDKDIASSLVEENNISEDINEAFNVSINSPGLLTYSEQEILTTTIKKESTEEAIAVGNFENEKACSNIFKNEEFKSSSESDVVRECHTDTCKNSLENSETADKDVLLNTCLNPSTNSVNDVIQNTQFCPEKISVDEVDLKFNNSRKSSDTSNFSLCVDIDLGENISTVNKQNEIEVPEINDDTIKRSSLHLWVSGSIESVEKEKNSSDQVNINQSTSNDDSLYVKDDLTHIPPVEISSDPACVSSVTKIPDKSSRDTGYYSFKSSDDSMLHDTPPPDEFMDVPNFKSLKRSIKKFPLNNTLSKSSSNINQVLSVSDTKFSTLQLKSQKSKGSSNSPSRQFTSLFSPTAVFKKLTGSKATDTQATDSSIPAKYLKKYARSSSIESDNMVGAISMPQLNFPKPGDSYSALGLYPENDRDSSLIVDDDTEVRRHPAYSHSVLSLGAHSVSMTSVYSAAACHYGYVTISGDVLFGLNYNQKAQMMEVFVKQCRNLAAVDARRNKSDPYVKVYLLPDKTKGGKRKTKTKKNTLNPVFNELLRFPVLKHELESRTLWLSVWNSDLFGRNDFLGEITLPLGYRLLDSPTLRWYPLQERMESLTSPLNYRGELFLALKYVPRDLSLESRFRPAPVISLRGALHILVKEARNISANGSGGNLDAFCKSYLLPDKSKSSKQKTPVVRKSRHPKWYYTVIYEDLSIDELKERSLELTVWDHDKITSNEFMGGIRLNLGSGLYHGVSVEWMDARRDEAALWQAMLQSPNMWVDGCLPLRPTMQFHHG